jgi:hypothetical protein
MEYSPTTSESPERLFLRYALPYAFHLIMQKKILKTAVPYLEAIYIENKRIEKKLLEKVFPRDYNEVIMLGEFNNKNITDYFLGLHNNWVDKDESIPEGLKDFCRIQEAQIIDMHDDYKATAVLNSHKIRIVKTKLVENISIGDLVKVHWYYVVDKI